MKNKTFIIWTVILIVFSIVATVSAIKIKAMRISPSTTLEKDFTPEQKAVLNALRAARVDVEQSKSELAKMIANARANLVAVNPVAAQPITWLPNGCADENGRVIFIINNNKPILWGLRQDGMVMWKAQP